MTSLLTAELFASAAAGFRLQAFIKDVPLPQVAEVDLVAAFFDVQPVAITTTVGWTQVPAVVEAHQLLTDATVWRRMFFRDWDRLPAGLRARGLDALLHHYSSLLATRSAGRSLTATDWDWIPQPIRAMAFVNMIEYWSARERPGDSFELDRDLVVRTVKAICMTESWFEHRAVHGNPDGSRDMGLAQASEYARSVTDQWHRAGVWPLAMTEEDYFNPWLATRWLVLWFDRMIREAHGDLDLAIRAYNVGRLRAATTGDAYHDVVLARRQRYFTGPSGSPSWATLSAFRVQQLNVSAAVPPGPTR